MGFIFLYLPNILGIYLFIHHFFFSYLPLLFILVKVLKSILLAGVYNPHFLLYYISSSWRYTQGDHLKVVHPMQESMPSDTVGNVSSSQRELPE